MMRAWLLRQGWLDPRFGAPGAAAAIIVLKFALIGALSVYRKANTDNPDDSTWPVTT